MMGVVSEETKEDIVHFHNMIRRKVFPEASNMLKMKWNQKASENAKKWVATCEERISDISIRTVNGAYCGENFLKSRTALAWYDVISTWGEGKIYFKYGLGPTKHYNYSDPYTQIIWYKSYLVGCALSYCRKYAIPFFYVCQYCPVGTIAHQLRRPYKKGKPCADCPMHCEDKLCTNPCKYTDHLEGCAILKNMSSCEEELLIEECNATCKCTTEIK
ncbi:cysteine-rich secretory protein 2-like [Varanus komodoensis]|uniref:cysteine-rich secretory protein 2-like n=1 Tax=Varanus komodoensis TaxID=61221 RepID=UPI001CF78D8E|nr:cysteine-rich secretory protein 2-like [Varanus komodoensis]